MSNLARILHEKDKKYQKQESLKRRADLYVITNGKVLLTKETDSVEDIKMFFTEVMTRR